MMDYMNLDDRSVVMFWVVSYVTAQPACETVMNWLTSAGVQELLPGSNLQSTERLMVMREVSPLPISLLSGFSINLCLKLAYLMEESMFLGQHLTGLWPSCMIKDNHSLIHWPVILKHLSSCYSKNFKIVLLLLYKVLPIQH